jgi:uncharacterized protein (TIGR02118 family)
MYKVVWLTKFRSDRDPEEMRRWWLDVHGPLFLKIPGVLRYVQNHWEAVNPASGADAPGEAPAYDGHAEAWFESEQAFNAALATDEFQAAIADVPSCFDTSTMVSGVLTEYIMKWDASIDGRPLRSAGTGFAGDRVDVVQS